MNIEKLNVRGLFRNYAFYRVKGGNPNEIFILQSGGEVGTLYKKVVAHQPEKGSRPGIVKLESGKNYLLGEQANLFALMENLQVSFDKEVEEILSPGIIYTAKKKTPVKEVVTPHPDRDRFLIQHFRNLDLSWNPSERPRKEEQGDLFSYFFDQLGNSLKTGDISRLMTLGYDTSSRGGFTIAVQVRKFTPTKNIYIVYFGFSCCSHLDNFHKRGGVKLAIDSIEVAVKSNAYISLPEPKLIQISEDTTFSLTELTENYMSGCGVLQIPDSAITAVRDGLVILTESFKKILTNCILAAHTSTTSALEPKPELPYLKTIRKASVYQSGLNLVYLGFKQQEDLIKETVKEETPPKSP